MFKQLKNAKITYHWVIAAIAFFQLFFLLGVANNFNALHLIPITEHLDISRGEYSVAYSVKSLVMMISTFFFGAVVSRLGYRKTAGFAMLGNGAIYFLLGYKLDSYALFYLYAALLGIFSAFSSSAAVTIIVTDWFHKHKGLVLGAVSASSGVGGSIICMIQARAIEKGGISLSFLFASITIAVSGLLILFFVRNKPAEKGLLPFGAGEEITARKKKISQEAKEGLSFKTLLRRPAFYLMLLLTLISAFALDVAFSMLIPHLVDCGISTEAASGVNSFLLLLLTAVKLVFGFLCDRIGAKKMYLACVAFILLSFVILCLPLNLPLAYVAAVVVCLACPISTIMIPLLAFSLFGHKAQLQYTGIFMAVGSGACLFSGPVANFAFDAFGSYRPAYLAVGAICTVAFFLYFVLFHMAKSDMEKFGEDSKKIQEEA